MINGDYNEFIDNLHHGSEMWFVYDEILYFVQGFPKNGKYNLYLDLPCIEGKGPEWTFEEDEKGRYPVEKFLSSPVFNGKTFREIEADAEWVDGEYYYEAISKERGIPLEELLSAVTARLKRNV